MSATWGAGWSREVPAAKPLKSTSGEGLGGCLGKGLSAPEPHCRASLSGHCWVEQGEEGEVRVTGKILLGCCPCALWTQGEFVADSFSSVCVLCTSSLGGPPSESPWWG